MMAALGDKKQEHLVVLYLDNQNRIIEEKLFLLGLSDVHLQNQEKFYTMPVKIWRLVSLLFIIILQEILNLVLTIIALLKK